MSQINFDGEKTGKDFSAAETITAVSAAAMALNEVVVKPVREAIKEHREEKKSRESD